LGEGVDQSKRLKHEAVDRVIHCLKDSAGHYRKLPRSCTGCGGDERCARCR
jgi:exopolyphosphatase/pppGpp-phosphohydrolase